MCASLDALKNERGNARESGARSDPAAGRRRPIHWLSVKEGLFTERRENIFIFVVVAAHSYAACMRR